MRVLIIEPHATGHHASYLRWLVQEASRKRWTSVLATTTTALSHPALSNIATEFCNVEVYLVRETRILSLAAANPLRVIQRELGYWHAFRRTASEVRDQSPVDYVIVPYLDYCFYAMGFLGTPFGGTPWCGITMRLAVATRTTSSPPLPWKWRVAKRILASSGLKALFSINPSVSEVPANWCSATELAKLQYLPDPAEYVCTASRHQSRARLDLSNKDVAILVFGSIDDRKGVDSLLEALSYDHELRPYVVILAGKQSSTFKTQLLSSKYSSLISKTRIIVIDRFVDHLELGCLLTASDVVWVGYRSHPYMSGVLVLAGKAGLPAIGTEDGEIGRLITRNASGMVATINRPTDVAAAMRAMLNPDIRSEMGIRATIAFENHTVGRFASIVFAAFDG